jgi:hypothetical protein
MVRRIMSLDPPAQDLSPPARRELLHLRDIALRGYAREDGQFDIEAHLVDTKTYGFANPDRSSGRIDPGEPLHEMRIRLTVDADMMITACPDITPNFARLAGLRIGPGFIRAAKERVGGVHGCTHLVELLQPLGTVAFQTLYAVRVKRAQLAAAEGTQPSRPPALLNTCHAYASDSPVVGRRWPQFYTGGEAPAGPEPPPEKR